MYTYAPLAEALKEEFPEIETSLILSFYYGFLACRTGDKSYNERRAVFTDPHFFNFLSIPLAYRDPESCLPDRNSVAISENAAYKYFGISNPLGRQLGIGHGQMFTVTAVYKNLTVNSNFQGDIILPLECISNLTQIWIDPSWNYESDIYTFVLLTEGANKTELTKLTGQFLTFSLLENILSQ